MAIISITRLRLRSSRFFLPFLWYSVRSFLQAKRAPGNLERSMLRGRDGSYWTLTSWRDEESVRAFMLSGAHRQAMPKLLSWCDEASVARYQAPSGELPDWKQAHRILVTQGRASKVHHPSPHHARLDFPSPVD